jgi:ABC-type polysaccharide/polyol phosphate transport system ATPase subunit
LPTLPEGTLRVAHVWKRFRADKRRRLIRDHLGMADLFRKRMRSKWRWVLRDISFHAEAGEAIGLIGANGSGKSTLLKILARVMYPTAGKVDVSGRVGALIEVRAGIHPDLTGRENTYLYGSLLGLRRREVSKRFEEIVEFAELQDAIDRQVKFYSSGMQMRLGFSVAAFLEPSILLVDEVLAVGDAGFQQRCLDRMRHVLTQGTTLLFVSHDLAAVEATCNRGLWLNQGQLECDGDINRILTDYRAHIQESAESSLPQRGRVSLMRVSVGGGNGSGPTTEEPLQVETVVESAESRSCIFFLGISEGTAAPVFVLRRDLQLRSGAMRTSCLIHHLPVPRGRFYVWIGILDSRGADLLPWHPAAYFDVAGPSLDRGPRGVPRLAPIYVKASWNVSSV